MSIITRFGPRLSIMLIYSAKRTNDIKSTKNWVRVFCLDVKVKISRTDTNSCFFFLPLDIHQSFVPCFSLCLLLCLDSSDEIHVFDINRWKLLKIKLSFQTMFWSKIDDHTLYLRYRFLLIFDFNRLISIENYRLQSKLSICNVLIYLVSRLARLVRQC